MTHRYTGSNADIDIAIDFAQRHRRGIKFCDEVLRMFERFGTITPRQVEALLRIRDQRGL